MKITRVVIALLVCVLLFQFSYAGSTGDISAIVNEAISLEDVHCLMPDSEFGMIVDRANQTGVVMHDFYGDIEFKTRSIDTGSYHCDITCEFTYSGVYYTHMYWRIVPYETKVEKVWLDGKPVKFKAEIADSGWMYISTELDEDFEYGEHSMRFKYNGKFNESNSDYRRYQLFVNGYHAHMYEGWWPHHFAGQYTDIIHTSFDLKMPNTWIMVGDFIPEKYRDKPNPKGEYHMEQYESYPPIMRICCGEYEVTKYEGDNYDIRMYAFRGKSQDAEYLVGTSRDAIEFFSEYYQHPCNKDFFLAAQTGGYGSGRGMDGGFIMDTNYLNKENMAEDFISHEVSHVCWWGGRGVMGSTNQPDLRFLNEATAEFSSLLFCEQVLSKKRGFDEWKQRIEWYRDTKDWYEKNSRYYKEPPISDPASATSFSITYYKGACVFWGLRYYMGEENFRNAMIEIFDEYARENAPSDDEWYRPSIGDFYQMFQKHSERDIDGYWDTYIGTVELPRLDYSIGRIKFKGDLYDSIHMKSSSSQDFPMMVHAYYPDGTYKEVTLEEKEKSFKFEGHASGIFYRDYMGSMPHPDDLSNKMNVASVAAVLAWNTPVIYVSSDDGQEYLDRATLWSEKISGEVVVDDFSELPFRKPILLVGPTAITKLAQKQYENLSVTAEDGYLNWSGRGYQGDYESIIVTYDSSNPEFPIIVDTGTGEIPENLSYTGVFVSADGRVKMGYNFIDVPSKRIPRSDELCQLPWDTASVTTDKSVHNISFTNPRPLKISYEGFSFEHFDFRKIEKEYEKDTAKIRLLLDLSEGSKQVKISHTDRFILEEWDFDVKLNPDVEPLGSLEYLTVPEFVSGDSVEIKWIDSLEYIYCIDGQKMTKWRMGSKMTLSDLTKGKHELKLLFIDNGLLSPLIVKEFVSGVKPPEITFDTLFALWKDGEIKITGKTNPGVTLEPAGTVDDDGNFEITVENSEIPENISVIVTDEYGLTATKSITVKKFIELTMHLGKNEVKGITNSWQLDVPPQLVNGSTYVPMRFIGERLGAEVTWIGDEKKVIYQLENTIIEIWIGKSNAFVNGMPMNMPGSPVIISGRTLVPVRFISEALGAKVTWYGADKKIVIEYPNLD